MKIWIALISGDAATGPKILARSGEPGLVRRFIAALQSNRLLEDDAADVIYDPVFLAEAERMMAFLTAQTRRDAVRSFSAEAERMMAFLTAQTRRDAVRSFSEVDPACSSPQESGGAVRDED